MPDKPLAIDLFCGLFGWSEGLIQGGYRVVGFDLEDMHAQFGIPRRAEFQLVIQDVLTLHGSQFKDAALIVASPPCQDYSYMAMPWSLAKAKAAAIRADTTGAMLADLTALFDACFRIQAEASLAAGRHIPMVVENVCGAQPWVGRARWSFGSYFLWGDVPALMPITSRARKFNPDRKNAASKNNGGSWFNIANNTTSGHGQNPVSGFKSSGMNWSDQTKRGQDFTRIAGQQAMAGIKGAGPSWDADAGHSRLGMKRWTNPAEQGRKNGNDWLGSGDDCSLQRRAGSGSSARKAASAMIAKIPEPLARHIAATFYPLGSGRT